MNKLIIFLVLCCSPIAMHAQTTPVISLSDLYAKLDENYPVQERSRLQSEITAIQNELTQTGWYPEITLGASASWQSEVTEVSFLPNGPEFSQDHYKLSLDVVQPLFEAGRVSKMKKLNEAQGTVSVANAEVEMQQLRTQVDQIYFGIIIGKKNLELLMVLQQELEEQLRAVKARVKNGVMLPGNQYSLEAEILKLKQQQTELEQNIVAGFEMLSALTGEEVSSSSELKLPGGENEYENTELNRAEFELFSRQRDVIETNMNLTGSDKLPVISAFGSSAYGRPGFNAFDDDLHFYWIVGVRAQWSFRNWRNSSKKAQILELQNDQLSASEDAFTRQLESQISKLQKKIEALEEQIRLDKQVLGLRSKVVEEKEYQLNEGAITSTEYITEMNAENRARVNLELHKIQVEQAYYELNTLRGNTWN